jgi:hypothetical protein
MGDSIKKARKLLSEVCVKFGFTERDCKDASVTTLAYWINARVVKTPELVVKYLSPEPPPAPKRAGILFPPGGSLDLGEISLRQLQTNLPWTVRYSQDFRSNPQSHKDFAHALVHVTKAIGILSALVDDMDHDRAVADNSTLRETHGKYVADLVVCALRAANTFPGGVLDLQRAVVDRIETKNGVKL